MAQDDAQWEGEILLQNHKAAQWHFPTAGVPFFLAKNLRLSYPSTADVILCSPLDSFSEAIESRNATDRAVGGH
jgi:hypothetical protein